MTSSRTAAAVLRRVAPVAVVAALLAGCAGTTAAGTGPDPVAVSRSARHLAGRRLARDEGDGEREDGEDGEDGERVCGQGPRLRRLGDARRELRAEAKRLHAKVFAHESRQSWDGAVLVRKDRTRGRIHGPVVIHTGTNGTVSRSDLTRTVQKVQKKHVVVLVNIELAEPIHLGRLEQRDPGRCRPAVHERGAGELAEEGIVTQAGCTATASTSRPRAAPPTPGSWPRSGALDRSLMHRCTTLR